MNTSIKKFLALLAALVPFVGLAGIALAGDLEPPGPPGPTMKTLDEVPPTWSQVLPASERFRLVMNGAAVLDKETGLVWERQPLTIEFLWKDAYQFAFNNEAGGRLGWRIPTIEELASLVDRSVSGSAKLPSGHPFTNVMPDYYWSSTTAVHDARYNYSVHFGHGLLGPVADNTAAMIRVWRVRGGYGHNGQ